MKRFLSTLVIFLITTININSFAYNTDPKLFVEELVDDAIKTLSNKKQIIYIFFMFKELKLSIISNKFSK